jgi:hypothetical protein
MQSLTLDGANVPRVAQHDNTLFRITTWPDQPLPHPPADDRRVAYRLTDRGMLIPDWDADWLPRSPRWSEECYLELIAVDLEDPANILEFVQVFGLLGTRSGRAANNALDLAGFSFLHAAAQVAEHLSEDHVAVAKADGLPERMGETLDEFRWGALCMRDLVSAWQITQNKIKADTYHWESPVWKIAEHPLDDVPWKSPDGPSNLLASGLSFGLESFAPVVRTHREEVHPIFEDHWAYEICCLELFNHIVEEASYRRCANETCRRLFVRQRGRAVHGQYRIRGVKYCSSQCARAQAQRQFRRRKTAASGSSPIVRD